MSQDVSTFFAGHIDAVRGLSGRPLDRAVSRLLRAFHGHIWGWATAACRAHGDQGYNHADDVFNIISLELSIVLRAELTNPSTPPILNFWSYFRTISQREAFAYFHSGEVTGMSNAGGAARRLSKINKTRKELSISTGREPSDQEVVDEVNRLAYETRSNPKKQGALVTLDDLKVTSFSSLDGLTEQFGDSIWADEESEESPLSRVEAPSLVEAIIEGCVAISDQLGDVAKLWIGDAMASPAVVRTPREIATLLTLKVGEASALVERAKDIAVTICEQNYGISSPFA